MIDNLILQIATDLSSFCHLRNVLGAIPAGRKKGKLLIAAVDCRLQKPFAALYCISGALLILCSFYARLCLIVFLTRTKCLLWCRSLSHFCCRCSGRRQGDNPKSFSGSTVTGGPGAP